MFVNYIQLKCHLNYTVLRIVHLCIIGARLVKGKHIDCVTMVDTGQVKDWDAVSLQVCACGSLHSAKFKGCYYCT